MAGTRASDADRELCLNDIESAFADGRIDDAEREARTQSALQAKTLDELARLTADLRPPGAQRPTTFTPTVPKGLMPKILVAAIIPAVAAIIIVIAASNGNDSTPPSTDTSQPNLGSQPKGTLKLHTAAGFEKFVAATRSAFGTTTVESAAIYPDYASVNVVVKDNPRRTERWSFREGYDGDPSKSTRAADDIVVDMAAVNVPALMEAVRRAPTELNVKEVKSIYIILDERDELPAMSVYVSNEYNESGYYVFTLDGKETNRYPFA
ncbi:hypothetical protein GCM10022234_08410 [Aeromicrobium panaciterrae]|uniref:DUF1707 SHOCT-like domain-containing protein n=1 Tax=Aeromicrobium panaciterrae TaxID=363861 RepID=UPI0031D44807